MRKQTKILILLLVTLFNISYGQTCFEILKGDYLDVTVSSDFKNFIKTDDDAFAVYQKLSTYDKSLRTDIEVLQFFKKALNNNVEKLGTKILDKLNTSEIKLFANDFKSLTKIQLEKFIANDELIDVWKKWQIKGVKKIDDIELYQKVWKQKIRNVSFDNFYFKTKDQIGLSLLEKSDYKFAIELFEAWKKGQGHHQELQQLYIKYGLNPAKEYPPCEGVWGITLGKHESKYFDRFQKYDNMSGSYAGACPEGSSYTVRSRSLKENYADIVANGEDYFYFKFKFKNSYTSNLEFGEAIPWFGKDGGAIQIKAPDKFNEISSQIEIAEKWKLENGQWVKVVNGAGKVLTSKPSWLPNRIISGNISNPKGLIGVYDKNIPGLGIIDDTKRMLSEIDFPMCNASNFKTASKDGFKLLNVPNDAVDMWATYNKPWIEALTNAKAEIAVLSDKGNDLLKYAINSDGTFKLVNGQKALTGFGKEIDFMETLVQQGKYQFDNVAGSYKYIGN